MAVAGRKYKEIFTSGAGGWALVTALVLLCLLFVKGLMHNINPAMLLSAFRSVFCGNWSNDLNF